MSTVNASKTNNPYAFLQYPQQQTSSPTGAGQSDPLSTLLAALGQGTGAGSSATATPSSAGAAPTSGSSSPQFGPQTLQTLFAMQANASNSDSLMADLNGSGGTGNQSAGQTNQQGQGSQTGNSNATGQSTTTNPNGSSTTTTTYADGASMTQTTAAPSDSSGTSSNAGASAGGANVANSNLLEQLIQIQSQLLNPATMQSVATV
jgi:hypothetical protein